MSVVAEFRERMAKLAENPRYLELREKVHGSNALLASGDYDDPVIYQGYMIDPESKYTFNSTSEVDEYIQILTNNTDN